VEDCGPVGSVARLTCVGDRLLEIGHRRRGFSPPVPQLSGKAERTRKPRLVIELPKDMDHTLELTRDLGVAQPRVGVRAKIG
jgi:hypothetical protein